SEAETAQCIWEETTRRLYCPECKSYWRRDVMVARDMLNIMKGYLLEQRPLYLQLLTIDNERPWDSSTAQVGTKRKL
ncbi:hypothetical protein BGX21_006564, partial [Mortierella sp. AD011]